MEKICFDLPKNLDLKNSIIKIENGKVIIESNIFNPQDGDFLVSSGGNVFIYNGEESEDSTYGAYVGITNSGIIKEAETPSYWSTKECCRFATESEKNDFIERLKTEMNKKWNPETKKLEDIYIPKFGDIVKVFYNECDNFKRNYMICIYPDKKFKVCDDFFEIPFINLENKLNTYSTGGTRTCFKIVPASDLEKQELFDRLAEVGLKWNEDTKKLEKLKWRPKDGEYYWYVGSAGDVVSAYMSYKYVSDYHKGIIEIGNCFKTKEEAQIYADKFKEIF